MNRVINRVVDAKGFSVSSKIYFLQRKQEHGCFSPGFLDQLMFSYYSDDDSVVVEVVKVSGQTARRKYILADIRF